jgi:hypothetical protein
MDNASNGVVQTGVVRTAELKTDGNNKAVTA